MYRFIKIFILCPYCKLPETRFHIKKEKNAKVKAKCKACGKTCEISEKEKLTGFIRKNPPTYPKETTEKEIKSGESSVKDSSSGGLTKDIIKKISKRD